MFNQIYLEYALNKFTGKLHHLTATEKMKLKAIT